LIPGKVGIAGFVSFKYAITIPMGSMAIRIAPMIIAKAFVVFILYFLLLFLLVIQAA
jgi:hypothetical protein